MKPEMQEFGHRKSDYLRPNQAWQCGRAHACKHGPNAKGRCSQSKQPCVPRRTVGSNKRLITLWVICVGIACIALVLSAPGLLPRLSPGPLSVGHAEVADCQDCHAAAKKSVSAWVKSAILFSGHNDDQQCLSCHKLGDNAFLAHSTSAENFSQSMPTVDDQSPLNSTADWKTNIAGKLRAWQRANSQSDSENQDRIEQISCSICHREHKGELNSRVDFNPQKCHTCHQKKFDAIEDGHPQYADFPHSKPTHIQFDHGSHLGKHFLEDDYSDKAPQGCKQCHVTDQTGEWMVSKSFETACSSCHLDDVLGSNRATDKGIAVLAIPELDVQSLNAAGLNVGQWPSWADGELTPFMRLLISRPNQSEKINLSDLSNASPTQLNASAQLAWDIKTLFYDMQMGGTEVIQQRISSAFGGSLERSTLNRLIAAFPRDTLINNQQEWFPDLMDEMKRYKNGEFGLQSAIEKALDPVKSRELEIIVDDKNADILSGNEDDILTDDEDVLSDDEEIIWDDDDDILSEEEDEILSDEQISNDATQLIASDNEAWAFSGGWYRDGSSIRYRPAGHADRFFKTWLDVSASQYGIIDKLLFESLRAEKSVGNCVKCHSIEANRQQASNDESSYKVHWRSFRPSDVKVDFNRFSHVSHFGLMTDDGCASCHVISSPDSSQTEAEDKPPILTKSWASGFESMERNTCTQCHQSGRAPDNCLTCHNYHAEPLGRDIENVRGQ